MRSITFRNANQRHSLCHKWRAWRHVTSSRTPRAVFDLKTQSKLLRSLNRSAPLNAHAHIRNNVHKRYMKDASFDLQRQYSPNASKMLIFEFNMFDFCSYLSLLCSSLNLHRLDYKLSFSVDWSKRISSRNLLCNIIRQDFAASPILISLDEPLRKWIDICTYLQQYLPTHEKDR